ncbi:hypothetical protein CAC42_532 [Sphaceloma murrayae]|uniref:VOC domain-containing protein n=1 Tax=Sphaceloma murrayae TaxID=2082308 RepID=A0A2K1R3S1_9PEZI|nr:hypothetical protein CAC42_532 [Sphaceloma murrayae]
MPVAHIGLSVENIAASASFYAAALQPLGYRYIGSRDDQLGFGVEEADFFLSPAKGPNRPSPVHVAFAANSRASVRNFYANALNAGGIPTGPPGYRGQELEVFNTAVLDLDGNTIEVVHQESDPPDFGPPPSSSGGHIPTVPIIAANQQPPGLQLPEYIPTQYASSRAPPPLSRASTRSARLTASVYSQRSDRSERSERSSRSKAPTSRSTMRSASCAPALENPSKTLVGTLLGAAAGAAAIYAIISSERDGARKERAFDRSMSRRHSYAPKAESGHGGYDEQSVGRISRARTLADVHDAHDTYDPYIKPIPLRSVTFDGTTNRLPRLTGSPHSPRRDSVISSSSRKSSRSQHASGEGPVFRDSFQPDRAIEWIPEDVEPSSRRSSAPSRRSSRRDRPRLDERRHSEYPPRSRISAADVPLPTSVVDSRASIRDKGLYQKSSRRSKGESSAPAPVSFETIRSSFGGKGKKGYADTVLPEDSISCASSRRSELKDDRKVRSGRAESLRDWSKRDERKGRRGPGSAPVRDRDGRYH